MAQLYICEKPSQAKDIAAAIGGYKQQNGYLSNGNDSITWCIGHLLEMAEPDEYGEQYKRWDMETLPISPQSWKLKVKKGGSKQFSVIKKLLKQYSQVVIATDADREGEVIAREVLEYCQWKGEKNRLWLSALDVSSVRKALKVLRHDQDTVGMYYAGLARGRSDWLVGMNLTRAMTVKGKSLGLTNVLSIGRVQTPTLALVVQRDLQIENFVAQNYYTVETTCNRDFTANWVPNQKELDSVCDENGRCIQRGYAEGVAMEINNKQALVSDVESVDKKQSAPLPFSLSELQKVCSSKWGLSPKKTLEIAQSLYEKHKLTSYPRTDCRYLPVNQFDEAPEILEHILLSLNLDVSNLIDNGYSTEIKSRAWNDKKITAHHGIIPTTSGPYDLKNLTENERQIFELIARNFVAQFFKFKITKQIKLDLIVGEYQLVAKGSEVINQSWNCVVGQTEKPVQIVPILPVGEMVMLSGSQCELKETSPPNRFTGGSLVEAMSNVAKYVDDGDSKKILKDNDGIGTEATRADIIDTLQKRKFIAFKNKSLVSTDLGRKLIESVPHDLVDPVTTALMERQLSMIEKGEIQLEDYLDRMASFVDLMINDIKNNQLDISGLKIKTPNSVQTDVVCEKCGKNMVKRKGKKGHFLGCSGYPDCDSIQFLNSRKTV